MTRNIESHQVGPFLLTMLGTITGTSDRETNRLELELELELQKLMT